MFNWKFWERRPPIVASPAAREAMGITDPATQGFAAVALAIGQGATLHEPEPEQPDPNPNFVKISDMVTAEARIAHLREFGPRTEYHLEMANTVATHLRQSEAKAVANLAEDRRASAERFAAQEAAIADLRQTLAFYDTAPSILATAESKEPPPTLPKPKRVRKPKPPADFRLP
jgi:hypothetical protein